MLHQVYGSLVDPGAGGEVVVDEAGGGVEEDLVVVGLEVLVAVDVGEEVVVLELLVLEVLVLVVDDEEDEEDEEDVAEPDVVVEPDVVASVAPSGAVVAAVAVVASPHETRPATTAPTKRTRVTGDTPELRATDW